MRRILAGTIISLFMFAPVHAATASGAGRLVPAAPRGMAPGKAKMTKKMAGYIGTVEGSALVLLDGVEPWVKAKVGQQLTPGTQVKTKAGSSVVIAFTDGSKVRLGANANFKLETVKRSKLSMYIGLGKLEAWVAKLARRTFQTRNPVAVASVRGTHYAQRVASKGGQIQATTAVFSGGVAQTDNFGRTVSIGAGQYSNANATSGSSAPKPGNGGVSSSAEPTVSLPAVSSPESAADEGGNEGEEEGGDETPADESGSTDTGIADPNPVQDTSTVSGSSPTGSCTACMP